MKLSAIGVACLYFALTIIASAVEPSSSTVSLQALLREMVDRDAPAQLPSPSYIQGESSSRNPIANDPNNPTTWHVNGDSGHFIRTELNEGRKEWVILDVHGPGAVTRIWTPLRAKAENTIIRFYFDGSSTPQIEANFYDLISGRSFVKPPLAIISTAQADLKTQMGPAYQGQRGVGADFILPIPFASGCKITLSKAPFYDIVNYRQYATDTPVQTFSREDTHAPADRGTTQHENRGQDRFVDFQRLAVLFSG